ncbi:MAG: AAA domain-containing protein [Caldithrix sp.]|nr:AAA domain-containing protein [Caldithrix sp.]
MEMLKDYKRININKVKKIRFIMVPKTLFISNQLQDYKEFIRTQIDKSIQFDIINHHEADNFNIINKYYVLFIIELHTPWLYIPLWIQEQAQQQYAFHFIFISDKKLPGMLAELLGNRIYARITTKAAREELSYIYNTWFKKISENKFPNNQSFNEIEPEYTPKILGNHPSIENINNYIKILSRARYSPCLIRGEQGVGKKYTSRLIHRANRLHDDRLFVKNCKNMTVSALLGDLFGVEEENSGYGKTRKGLFELYNEGTIILEEIEKMPKEVQKKLLYYLDTKTYRPLASKQNKKANIRIIGITRYDLQWFVKQQLFNQELYYHLNAFEIYLPPLNERERDILLFIQYFLEYFSSQYSKKQKRLSQQALHLLQNHHWAGNIRELENVIERAVFICNVDEITPKELPVYIKPDKPVHTRQDEFVEEIPLKEMEKKYIKAIVEKRNGNKSQAADILGISRTTLREKLKDY